MFNFVSFAASLLLLLSAGAWGRTIPESYAGGFDDRRREGGAPHLRFQESERAGLLQTLRELHAKQQQVKAQQLQLLNQESTLQQQEHELLERLHGSGGSNDAAGLAGTRAVAPANAAAGAAVLQPGQGQCDPALAQPPPGWQPCSMRYIQVNMATREVTANFVSSGPWGNLLAPYFQGLSLAQLLGFRFVYGGGFVDGFLTKLPRVVEPGLVCPNATEVVRACQLCQRMDLWEFTMNCPAGWTQARAAIVSVTRGAIQAWAAENNKTVPAFEQGDVVIQVRCARDTLLAHPMFGPSAFSHYLKNLPADTRRLFAVYAHHGHNSPNVYTPCDRIVEAMGRYFNSRRPDLQFSVVSGERWEDFARLAYAPTLFKDSCSSFGHWAGLANAGRVFFTQMGDPTADMPFRDLKFVTPTVDATFTFVNTTVLWPAVAQSLGMRLDQDLMPEEQISRVVQWLETSR
ncbi:hypothetical protein HYH03_017974 [Edaphochlamys debaryana]|uniref:Uncharacterized protein n=1 Tax=Edaphochlamys debaryana TaxID=47281 RepID=A0A835XHZ8_9CHLO|nr:hypothetical protein HYH03_017974 [Edaphochlamys debaryana]|eukprot:KAG2483128.1 hypothetical protein HYH03_017974 [Edaphochlamys debaryana]